MKNVRRVSQGIFLLVFFFLFLQTQSKGRDELGYPVKIFLDFDPLVFLTTLFASHAVETAFYLSLVLVAATAILGRVFCGWICPMGTLNNVAGLLRPRRFGAVAPGWSRMKYYLLVFLLAASVFSLQLVGIMDPLSLLIRSLSVSIYPLFNHAVNALFDVLYRAENRTVFDAVETTYRALRKTVLAFEQPSYRQAAFIGGLFLVILGLNLLAGRFWCKALCPLGALLGVLSRFSILKRSVSEGCTSCGRCASVCQGAAAPDKKDGWRSTECLYCWNCDDVCPQNAVSFGFGGKRRAAAMDLGRRRVVASALSGVFAVPFLRLTPHAREAAADPSLVRPPGSRAEGEFLRRCVKCGECMKVCITNGLQPTLLEAGFEGIWSPVLVPRMGYCEYRCTLCGQVCPTGAIKRLTFEEKSKVRIGLAMIDKGRCLPWAHARPCIVCEEVCPTPKKAIWLEDAVVSDRTGNKVSVKQPRVDLELCIGCGVCEAKCPVGSRAAITVTSIGETRSRNNQILL